MMERPREPHFDRSTCTWGGEKSTCGSVLFLSTLKNCLRSKIQSSERSLVTFYHSRTSEKHVTSSRGEWCKHFVQDSTPGPQEKRTVGVRSNDRRNSKVWSFGRRNSTGMKNTGRHIFLSPFGHRLTDDTHTRPGASKYMHCWKTLFAITEENVAYLNSQFGHLLKEFHCLDLSPFQS